MSRPALVRGIDLRGAVAINMITMIGIGPLITIPLVLAQLHGPLSIAGWVVGALLALCDGLVWAELGSLLPGSGGTYGFLRAAFPPAVGRALAFLFVWEMIFAGPLLVASGYIGFAGYATFLFPTLAGSAWAVKAIAAGVGCVTLAALYRRITSIAQFSLWLGVAAVVTLLSVTVAGYAHFSPHLAFALGQGDSMWTGLLGGLGAALVYTMYDYVGYGQVTCVGDEVAQPRRTLPRAIIISIFAVGALYVAMQVAILGAVHWQQLDPNFPGSQVVAAAFGHPAAVAVTLLILLTAFASVYGNLLGFSRIPFAAARDGAFLAPFARVHPALQIPSVSLLVVGLLAIAACAFTLDQVIAALTAGLVLVQSIAQIAGLIVLRARGERGGYRMPLYPLPALVAAAGWIVIFFHTGTPAIVFGLTSVGCGALVYAFVAKRGDALA